MAQVCRGSHHGVPGTVQGVQGSAIVAYLALSKGGPRVHYPRVTTIQGWFWGPLSKGGHYQKVRFSSEKQGFRVWPGVHYPRVATIQAWIWGPLSKGGHYPRVATIAIQGWPPSKGQLGPFQIDFDPRLSGTRGPLSKIYL